MDLRSSAGYKNGRALTLTIPEQPLRMSWALTPCGSAHRLRGWEGGVNLWGGKVTSIEPSVSTRISGSQLSSGMSYLPLLRPQIYRWDGAGCQSGAGAGVGVSAHHCHL